MLRTFRQFQMKLILRQYIIIPYRRRLLLRLTTNMSPRLLPPFSRRIPLFTTSQRSRQKPRLGACIYLL